MPRYKWQYVSILGDEYLTSPMTDLDYESNSKWLVRAPSGAGAIPARAETPASETHSAATEAAGELLPAFAGAALVGTRQRR